VYILILGLMQLQMDGCDIYLFIKDFMPSKRRKLSRDFIAPVVLMASLGEDNSTIALLLYIVFLVCMARFVIVLLDALLDLLTDRN
jgi:hypothetical protein